MLSLGSPPLASDDVHVVSKGRGKVRKLAIAGPVTSGIGSSARVAANWLSVRSREGYLDERFLEIPRVGKRGPKHNL